MILMNVHHANKITDEHVIINISFVEQLILLLSWVIKTGEY